MKYLLAHDLGTSGNKASLFTVEGQKVASEVFSYNTKWYNQVWAEQNPEDWYEAVRVSTAKVLEGVDPADVMGFSFSAQMMGCLCVDAAGRPLHPAIIWADMRATEEERYIKEQIPSDEFYRITGHRPSASYSLAKLLWLKKNKREVYENCYKMLNAKDYIIQRLTGEFVTDYSDASGTNLLDINSLQWSRRIASAVNVDLEKMPDLLRSTDVVGSLREEAAVHLGLRPETKVVCGGGDGSMSAVGALCTSEGDAFCTLGTSAWNATSSSEPVYDPEMRTFNWVHVVPGLYVPCGTMQAAGASMSWLRDQLALIEDSQAREEGVSVYRRIDTLASGAEAGAGGLFYLPYLMGERSPRWNPEARGGFIGLKMETSRAEIFRSVMEGVAFNLEIILKLVLGDGDLKTLVMTGGGAKSRFWCQIFADIYNMTIKIPNHIEEATSIGAAVSAGVGLGVYDSFKAIEKFIKISDEVHPNPENAAVYEKMKPLFDRIYGALEPVYHEMTSL